MQLLINIDVESLDRAIAFYTRAFDLRIGRHFGDWVELVGGTSPIYLLPKDAGTQPSTFTTDRRSYSRHWTPLHLDFVVDDIEAALARALEAGAKQEAAVSMHKWGKLALLADPFGNGFCFVQFTGRGYDEIAD
jgi:predicted enzyme related to lactoylglutathione lyase